MVGASPRRDSSGRVQLDHFLNPWTLRFRSPRLQRMFHAFELQASKWHVLLLSRIAIAFAVVMIIDGFFRGDNVRVGGGLCWLLGFSALLKWWDFIEQEYCFNVLSNIMLVLSVVNNNVVLVWRLHDDIPNIEQLEKIMTNIVWALVVPKHFAVLINCEFVIIVLLECGTFYTLCTLPAMGIGDAEYWRVWTGSVMVANLWFGHYQARLKRDTFLLLLASENHVHEDHLELLTHWLESPAWIGEDEESPVLTLPELTWDSSWQKLQECINSTTLQFHEQHLNRMYQEWKQFHSSAFLRQIFASSFFIVCLAAVMKDPGVTDLLTQPAASQGALCITVGLVLSLCSHLSPPVRTNCWNVYVCFCVIFALYWVHNGLDGLNGHYHTLSEESLVLKKWGIVSFGYVFCDLALTNIGIVAGCDFLVLSSVAVVLALMMGIFTSKQGLKSWGLHLYVAIVQTVCCYQYIRSQRMQALWRHWHKERLK